MNPHVTRGGKAFTLLELMLVTFVIAVLVLMMVPARSRNRRGGHQINCVNNLKQVGLSFRIWGGDNGDKYPILATFTNETLLRQAALRDGTGAAYMYQVFQVMSNELGTPRIMVCPSDSRTEATNFDGDLDRLANFATSYFTGKDADETNPQQFLAGDRNIGVMPANGWSGNDPDGGVTGFSPNFGKAGSCRSLASYTNNASLMWTDNLHKAKGNIALSDGSVQQFSSSTMRRAAVTTADPTWLYFP